MRRSVREERGAVVAFGAAIFASALLLFCLQPMVGKMLLAPLGGAPAIWNACMLFFQGLLLGGYLYAHLLGTKLGVRGQAAVHIALVALPWLVLPVLVRASPPAAASDPTLSVLAILTRSVALPFFVLSTTAPLLQRWFSLLGHPSGRDPYFLYAASNLGSMVALVAYPVILEPGLGLAMQARAWSFVYALFGALVLACAVLAMRARSTPALEPEGAFAAAAAPVAAPPPATGRRDRLRWLALSFVPSSLLMGVTQHVTTDIAAIPLFWVVPLALYLLTYMLVFARRPPVPHRWMARIYPLFATITLVCIVGEASEPRWLVAFVHVATAFVGWMVCHGELVATRPHPSRLTEFYLFMSLGGVLGGVFNALIAPLVFTTIFEYPLAVVAVAFCRPRTPRADGVERVDAARTRLFDRLLPAGLGLFTLLVAIAARARTVPLDFKFLVAPALFVNYRWLDRRGRFAGGLASVLVASAAYPGHLGEISRMERNFFGVVRVTRDPTGTFTQIVHGSTVHGRQSLDPARRREPLTYYHPTGPIGDVFAQVARAMPASHVAVIGLGAGALACYARANDQWTFYEINPAVVRMAKEDFSFLRDAAPGLEALRFEIGDARLELARAPQGSFDVIALDAFSSDAIPAHLLTGEALDLYLSKLAARGLLAMHVSNRYLDLVPPIARLAATARLAGRVRDDRVLTEELLARGKTPSTWVVLARDEGALGALAAAAGWTLLPAASGRPWTDDYSNVVSALRR